MYLRSEFGQIQNFVGDNFETCELNIFANLSLSKLSKILNDMEVTKRGFPFHVSSLSPPTWKLLSSLTHAEKKQPVATITSLNKDVDNSIE